MANAVWEMRWPAYVRRSARSALRWREGLVLALAAAPRLLIAYTDHGMIWGDEIYQSLEPAHRLAFGYGITVWEFRDGARSWLFPGILAVVMKLGALFGAHTGLAVVGVTKTFMVAVGLAGVLVGMRLAGRIGGDTAALMAGAFAATFPPSLVFGSRAMGETASGTLAVVAAWLADSSRAGYAWLAGAVAGAAIYFRYQNGLIAVGLFVLLVFRRRFMNALRYGIAATIMGLLGGALDYVTWGRFFHSFLVYWKFNFVEGNANRWGTSPWYFYLEVAKSAAGPVIFLIALGAALSIIRAPGLFAVALLFVAAHCYVPHKEFRFLMPIVPLSLTLAAIGLSTVLDRIDRRHVAGPAIAAVAGAFMLFRTRSITLGEMGQFADAPQWRPDPPWNFFGGVNRALAEAGEQTDLCGVTIFDTAPWWMGGFSYLHRNVPLFVGESPTALASSNYLIMPGTRQTPAGYALVAAYRDYLLLRRGGSCAPRPPDYRHPLE